MPSEVYGDFHVPNNVVSSISLQNVHHLKRSFNCFQIEIKDEAPICIHRTAQVMVTIFFSITLQLIDILFSFGQGYIKRWSLPQEKKILETLQFDSNSAI